MQNSLDFLKDHDHEQLVYRYDRETGLQALIAVHSTTLGPGLGGTRLWRYATIGDAANDVLRLSEGMTYKAAVAGLSLGGGKSVIMADGKEKDPVVRQRRFEAFGRMIESIGGDYIAAEDVGTKPMDMVYIKQHTDYVVGMPVNKGGSGDPSPMTALGVFHGIRALVEAVYHTDNMKDLRVAIQGLGKVGMALAKHLMNAGAYVTGTDVSPELTQYARELGMKTVPPEAIYDVPCDIFSPSALGAVINDDTIKRLTCKIVAGPANNQLETEYHGQVLHDLGITYGVDYVLNSGGLINVAAELDGYDENLAHKRTLEIYDTIKHLLEISHIENIPTTKAAAIMAKDALEQKKPITA